MGRCRQEASHPLVRGSTPRRSSNKNARWAVHRARQQEASHNDKIRFMSNESNGSLPGILPHHLAELRKSGLSDATIVAAGIKSETSYQRLAAMLGHRKLPKRLAPAIV